MPAVELEAIESTPNPYLPASIMPDGEIDDAVTIGMSSWRGKSWSRASLRVNHSLSWLKRSSSHNSGVITPSASS